MGKFFGRILFWVLALGIAWLAGNHYGAPNWLASPASVGFQFIEAHVHWIHNRLSGTESGGGDDATNTTEPPAGNTTASETILEANKNLLMNKAGYQIIKDSEGLFLEAYESGGRSYIGYGHQRKAGDPTQITEAQADQYLRDDVSFAADFVRRKLTRAATENQFSAMVSLAYNLGIGNFQKSLVLSKFNDGDIQGAADAFRNHNKAGGRVLEHLTDRREKERALFLR